MKESIRSCIVTALAPFRNLWFRTNFILFKKRKDTVTKKKYYVAVCAIFKDEAPYIKEWVEYYKLIGVEHIFMYNNFSSDGFLEVLTPYINDSFVTLIDWPVEQGQKSAYIDCVKNFSDQCNWIAFFDLDEFFVSAQRKSVGEILASFEEYPSVVANWKTFGSSGIESRDIKTPVIKDFVACTEDFFWGKYFYNTNYKIDYTCRKNSVPIHSVWIKVGGGVYSSCYF